MITAKCPYCHRTFRVEDIHKPVKCPNCGALLTFSPPDFKPSVLITPSEMVSSER